MKTVYEAGCYLAMAYDLLMPISKVCKFSF